VTDKKENAVNIVDFILDLFAGRAAREHLGEAVSMSQHMEQTAACAAADAAPDKLLIAALLHDIGHFIGDRPIEALENGCDYSHEEAGADYLRPYFPPSITEPIRLHVAAKRYLCATDGEYFDRLSDASVSTLQIQGGPMSTQEIACFEANPYYRDAVKLRRYDDDGKVAGLTIKLASAYRATLLSQLLT